MTLARRFVSQIFCAAAMAGALAFGSASSLSAQEVTLKMHQFLPATANAPKLVLDVWADRVEKDSGGRIKVDHYPSMQLGASSIILCSNGSINNFWVLFFMDSLPIKSL